MGTRATWPLAVMLVAAGAAASTPAAPAGEKQPTGITLEVLGQTDLGGGGLNGDVAVSGTTALVGAGLVPHTGFHTERYNPLTCFTVAAKVVDLSDPRQPRVAATIPLPQGVAANDVDLLQVRTPTFTGLLGAIALDDAFSHLTQSGCQTNAANPGPNFVDRGIVFYDLTRPDEPRLLSRYMADQGPTDDVPQNALPCGAPPEGAAVRCAFGQHSVSLVQREDGRVLSISVEPVADVLVKPSGDVRVVDLTDPTKPNQLSAWPELGQRPHPTSTNGCDPYVNSHGAEFYDGGRGAVISFMDGGVFDLDVFDPAKPRGNSQFAYPSTREEEGNAGFATTMRMDGATYALVAEDDWHPSTTSLRISSPPSLAGVKFACEGNPTQFDPTGQAPLFRKPNGAIAGEIVYGGRGCPVRGNNLQTPEDPYPADPRGKIVLLDPVRVTATQPGIPNQACRNEVKFKRAQEAGALAVVLARVIQPPLAAGPQAAAWNGDPAGITIPGAMIDVPDAEALRSALCPRLEEGRCAGGQTVMGELADTEGEWGGLRVLELDPDTGFRQVALVHSPTAAAYPPPDAGVYAPKRLVTDGDRAYVAWHADGVRVIDLGEQPPRDVASFVPPDKPDPTRVMPAKASVQGVALGPDVIVISDLNTGLYVLSRPDDGGSGGSGGGIPLAVVVGGVGVLVVAATVLVLRRRRAT